MSGERRGVTSTDFTQLTFEEIKQKLVDYAQTHYPETYKDFNDSSFGSMMFDLVSMVSEQLNFYTQFVANESFVQYGRSQFALSAHEREKTGKSTRATHALTATGDVKFYTFAPADPILSSVDLRYKHKILRGAKITSPDGAIFTTIEDGVVDLDPQNLIGTHFSEDGTRATYYIYETTIPVISGEDRVMQASIGTYEKFLKIEIRDPAATETLKVVDSNGNEYFEVEHLGQDTVWKPLVDRNISSSKVSAKMVPFPVPRRFCTEHEGDKTFLVFGFGSESDLKTKHVADPAEISMKQTARPHVEEVEFDSSKLLSTDKFGVAPQNTTLTIDYKANTIDNSHAAAGTVNSVVSSEIVFEDEPSLDASKTSYIRANISTTNKEPINGTEIISTTQEYAQKIRASLGTQSRAVTLKDYVAAAYLMPAKFGTIRRAAAVRDEFNLNKNINMYIISQNAESKLETASSALKRNLKSHLGKIKMISDTIDVYDALIVNFGLKIDVNVNNRTDFATALAKIRQKVFEEINNITPEIGQAFSVGEVEKILNSMPDINRVNSVRVVNKIGSGYSDTRLDVPSNLSPDGGLVYLPENCIWEIKNSLDITGMIR
tara:strand:+ start:18868 stop:20679 length:1812 start_codon:yes stop_codon:yes gene_type:complete